MSSLLNDIEPTKLERSPAIALRRVDLPMPLLPEIIQQLPELRLQLRPEIRASLSLKIVSSEALKLYEITSSKKVTSSKIR